MVVPTLFAALFFTQAVTTVNVNRSDCQSFLSSPNGSFNSPNYPNDYPSNLDCSWQIITAMGTRIKLDFYDFHLENCCDFVRVYDGPTTSSTLLLTHNGQTLPRSIVSSENALLVILTTDYGMNYRGFQAHYETFPADFTTSTSTAAPTTAGPDCGGTLYGSGYLLSPNYPLEYFNDSHCTWYLQSNAPQSISLRFEMFSTEVKIDYVSVWEGWNPEVGALLLDKRNGLWSPFTIESNATNKLTVYFFSDDSITGPGFRAFFSGVVGQITQ